MEKKCTNVHNLKCYNLYKNIKILELSRELTFILKHA